MLKYIIKPVYFYNELTQKHELHKRIKLEYFYIV